MLILLTFFSLLENDQRSVEMSFFIRSTCSEDLNSVVGSRFTVMVLKVEFDRPGERSRE